MKFAKEKLGNQFVTLLTNKSFCGIKFLLLATIPNLKSKSLGDLCRATANFFNH